jgi:hypothetical protein
VSDSPHVMTWLLRVSLAYQAGYSCGWRGTKQLMERDATKEWRAHNKEKHNG